LLRNSGPSTEREGPFFHPIANLDNGGMRILRQKRKKQLPEPEKGTPEAPSLAGADTYRLR
jgi:hypothetical protein